MSDLTDEQIKRVAQAVLQETLSKTTRLSRDDAADLVAAAATKAVNEAHVRLFAHLGYDMANTADLKRLRANMDFMERLRYRCEGISSSVSNAVANAIAVALMGLVALGAYFWMRGGGPPQPPTHISK